MRLVLNFFIAQVVERLQNQEFEQNHHVDGFAASFALVVSARQLLEDLPQEQPRHYLVEVLQLGALLAAAAASRFCQSLSPCLPPPICSPLPLAWNRFCSSLARFMKSFYFSRCP